ADLKSLVKDAVAEALGAKGSVVETLALRDCGPPVRTLRAAIKAGELSACRVGREYRVRRADLEAWLEARRVEPRAAVEPTESPADRALARAISAGGLRVVKGRAA